jgi:hypothetical protein
MMPAFTETNFHKQVRCPRFYIFFSTQFQGHHNIFKRRERWQQLEVLKYETDVLIPYSCSLVFIQVVEPDII